MNIDTYLLEKKKLIDEALNRFLPVKKEPPVIYESMRYSVFAGGKRFRPILFLAVVELFRGDNNLGELLPVACAIELIHTYSLVHDDLPAMDNDDLRRGKPTSHKVFGEGFAVLTGDALLTYAFEIIALTAQREKELPVLHALVEIAQAAGVEGMIGGQALDLFYEDKEAAPQVIEKIHRRKTGALITVSARAAALLTEASKEELARITSFAQALGLAFQIVDDLLDLTGDEKKLGKKTGADLKQNKATFLSVYGEERSREMVANLYQEALEQLASFGKRAEILKKLAHKLILRDY